MVYELRRINVWSVIKIVFLVSFFLGALIGIFYAFTLAMIDQLFQSFGEDELDLALNFFSGTSLFFLILFFAIFTSVFNSVISAAFVSSYNLLAHWIGGLKFDVTSSETDMDNGNKVISVIQNEPDRDR